MLIPIKEEVAKKEFPVRGSVLFMGFFLLTSVLTGIVLYGQTFEAESHLYTVFGIAHRLSAFAALCFAGYNVQLIAPWFFTKTKGKLGHKSILTLVMSGLFLVLLITIIAFEPENEIRYWIVIHGNAGMGFFISVIFYLLLHHKK